MSDAASDVTGHILVVDDELKNRELLTDILESKGHRVTCAENGKDALRAVSADAPDVVLLDVMMPDMDGFEVCRRLKAVPATAPIPVLLVTALRERDLRLKGIKAGANDFISKPIDIEEIALRTRNACRSKQLYDEVGDALHRLQEMEELRDNLVHMIIHDLRSVLSGVSGYLHLLVKRARAKLEANEQKCLDKALSSSDKLNEMISSLLDVSRLEAGEMTIRVQRCEVGEIAQRAAELAGGSAARAEVVVDAGNEPSFARCDQDLICRVMINLITNAMKFAPSGSEVNVRIQGLDGATKVSVTDSGPGIPEEHHERIFRKFGQVEMRQQGQKYSTGLGLTFCKLAVEAHGGTIGLESEVGEGSTFWFCLPCVDATG